MEVIIAKHAGFCFGVKRALQLVEEERKDRQGEVATLGEVIHNPQVVEKLSQAGVKQVGSPEEMKTGTLIISCHGVGPGVKEEAEKAGLEVVDATCPFVARAQELVSLLAREGYEIIIFGDRGHREVTGLEGYGEGRARIVDDIAEVEQLPFCRKLGMVVQTTREIERYQDLLARLGGKCQELRAFNTICEATLKRQKAAVELAGDVDLMLVVGGRNSANTRRLAKVCAETGAEVRHIETAEEISPEWLKGHDRIGITAGASTPQWIIDEVAERLRAKK
ncbi:MAG: 4-hydroxy-3-methylbut-2-enyl diphosphate reductase [Armatimonadetes bacterium]|nr:4-hydroxy-3-methylbut-2-enyl diphosphate reductase [Armatimonadota bacterium]NIM23120.1 4-hydroxy-3-methylbut-2-enyl diphosphate reductase [Armatimonadota bacterium]NIM66988.1 4-hydroxy-3-methylbut-2-enyl diphosphate reductase [Armatimonadota bacterium]NIM75522.1 4-hydroxy-3-methylbut-2-enyl diphosphate reductase [Armatimonadota bacterium]NIN05177.1 4-hydroxy-3-methylbut-2-enyl diphosphate reductase [Armatimonadota bacterium]